MKIMIQRQIMMAPYVYYKVGVELEGPEEDFKHMYKDANAFLEDLIKKETEWYAAEGCYNAHERSKK